MLVIGGLTLLCVVMMRALVDVVENASSVNPNVKSYHIETVSGIGKNSPKNLIQNQKLIHSQNRKRLK